MCGRSIPSQHNQTAVAVRRPIARYKRGDENYDRSGGLEICRVSLAERRKHNEPQSSLRFLGNDG